MASPLFTYTVDADLRKVDYHMHTDFSDGDSTASEYIEEATRLGLDEIAFTDHVWRTSDWVADYVGVIETLNEQHDIEILAGLEAKVIDREGNVDVSEGDAERVDFVMGVVHRFRPEAAPPYDDSLNLTPEQAAEEECELTLAMLENPVVDVIGHPSRTYYKFHYDEDTPEYPDHHLRRMIERSAQTETPLEFNARLPQPVRERHLELYLSHQLPFTTGSDSHHASRLESLNHDRIAAAIQATS